MASDPESTVASLKIVYYTYKGMTFVTQKGSSMARKNLALVWRNRLASQEGWSGRLIGVYLLPRANRITHVVVKRGLFGKPEVFSLEGSQSAQDGTLLLAKSAPEMPARGSVHLTGKTPVNVAHSHGSLQGLVVDAKTRTPRHILVRYKGGVRAVRHELVHGLADGSPAVRVTAEEAEALPFHRPDSVALSNAIAALEKANPMGDTFAAMDLEVQDGVARLTGNVPLPVQREEVEQAVRRARGVLEVDSAIVTDSELRLAIAAALAREGISRQGLVTVRSIRGVVTLLGRLPSQETVDQAVALAKAVSGVRSVASEIEVTQQGEDQIVAEASTQAANAA